MMVLVTCAECGIRFYAPQTATQETCWRCERRVRAEDYGVADRLLAQVFPGGLPADPEAPR